ncbi:MAG: hypothetical protein MI976_23780 [Pseudomonadales bacterium]|nr:hypothetical protein [Pseudomonadales bacterium]
MNKRLIGTTLVELILAIAIVSVAITGMMAAYSSIAGRSADPLVRQQSLSIAHAIMEEIVAKPFLEPDDGNVCPAESASRSDYDNVCDYNGFAMNPITDLAGNPLGLSGYSVSVAVSQVGSELGSLSSSDTLRIDVTVNNPLGSGSAVLLTSYRTRY